MDELTTVKRLHYFDHQFLRAQDFSAEQDYHTQQRRLHNRFLHSPGIAGGLDVTFAAGDTAVTVGAGVAVDGLGREIVVASPQTLPLSGQADDAAVYVTIAYGEELTDATSEGGSSGETRWTEQPKFALAPNKPSDPAQRIVLALVKCKGHVVDEIVTDDRRYAGAAAGSLEVRDLTLRDPNIVRARWVKLHLARADTAQVAGSLEVTGQLSAPQAKLGEAQADNATVGQQLTVGQALVTPQADIARLASENLTISTGGGERVRIGADGSIGIGTDQPQTRFHIEGTEVHSGGWNAGYSFSNRGSQWVASPGAGERWTWYAEGGSASLWSGVNKLTVSPAGDLSVGRNIGMEHAATITSNGRMHIAGEELLFLLNKAGVVVGKNWGGNGNLTVEGNLQVNGVLSANSWKEGYVADAFVNAVGDTIEQGDVVMLAADQSGLQTGHNDLIPIPEVDLAREPNDTRVCGIVCAVTGEAVAKSKRKNAAQELRRFSEEELEAVDTSKIGPGQIGVMVTLGAFGVCKVDAAHGAIAPGDLLTTSATPGHAMKADPAEATGAVVGKALSGLARGKGKIPIMVFMN